MRFNYFKQNFSHKKANRTLAILLSLDIVFIILHALLVYLVFIRIDFDWSITPFMLNNDDGYPEMFQYLKFLAAIIMLIYLLIKGKGIGYISWLLLFVLMLFDDSLKLHERFGAWVVEKFNYKPMFGLRDVDLGELTFVALFGIVLLFFIVIGYYYGDKKYRKTNIDLGILFFILLCFGVGVDMIHEFVEYNRYSDLLIILIEDGGEMIALSLFVWYFLFTILKPINHDTYLFQYFYKPKKSIN